MKFWPGHDGALADGRDADADVRLPVDGHLAVRAVAGAALEAARAVVLEAPREDPATRGVERRADRVARVRVDGLAVVRDRQLLRAVDQLAGMLGEPGHAGSGCHVRVDLVGVRVPLGEEPLLAHAAEPPLALDAPLVVADVDVVVELALGRRRHGPLRRLPGAAELLHLTRAAVGAGDEKRHTVYVALSATACRRSQRYPTIVARRRQPSSGRIEASSRAVAILDALADGGEIGTNELARRTGLPAEHRVAPARHPRRDRSRRAGRRVGAVPPRDPRRPARERRSRTPRRPPHRSPPPRGARADHRRDRDAARARRGGRGHGRLRAERALHPARDAARPPVDRPCDLGGEGDARVHRPPPPARAAPCVHAADDHEREGALASRSSACGRRATPRRSRSASRASRRSPHRCGPRPAPSPRSSRSRARPRASGRTRCAPRSRRCSSGPRRSRPALGWVPG